MANKYSTILLYLDLEDKSLKDNFNWVIDNKTVSHSDYYHGV